MSDSARDNHLILDFSKKGKDSNSEKFTDKQFEEGMNHYIGLITSLDYFNQNTMKVEMFEMDSPEEQTEIRLYSKNKELVYKRAYKGKTMEARYVCAYFMYLDLLNQGMHSIVSSAIAYKKIQKEEEKIANKLFKK